MDFTILAFCHPYCLEGKCNMHLSEIWHSKKNDSRLSRTQVLCEFIGCVVGIVSVVYIAKAMGASREVILSLASKSVTTPIAMELTKSIGGIPPLTAAVVVCVGLMCAVCGYRTMGFARVKSPVAQGLSMGTAAHAVGTATAMEKSPVHGAYASLGLTLNGILTSLLTPSIIPLLGV